MSHDADIRLNSPMLTLEPVDSRNRGDYWFPMSVFGILVLCAPLVYRPSGPSSTDYDIWNPTINTPSHIPDLAFAPLQQFSTYAAGLGDPMAVALYWFSVVMFGPLLGMWWYHRKARRDGSAPQTGWYLLYSCTSLALYVVLFPVIEFVAIHLPDQTTPSPAAMRGLDLLTVGGFVAGIVIAGAAAWPCRSLKRMSTRRWTVSWLGMLLAIAAAAAIEFLAYVQPRDSYGPLLLISVGLLAFSLVDRSRVCAVVAVLFTAAALVVNLVGARSVIAWWGGTPDAWPQTSAVLLNLALPGVILLVGSLIGAVTGIRGSVAARYRAV